MGSTISSLSQWEAEDFFPARGPLSSFTGWPDRKYGSVFVVCCLFVLPAFVCPCCLPFGLSVPVARLWSVDERTVKREMAKLRGLGWLVVKRQGARGRVTEYGLDLERILSMTQAEWPNVGPDFDLRMSGKPEESPVVPLPVKGHVPEPDVSDGTEWALAQAILYAEAPDVYGSWLRNLIRVGRAGGRLTLRAPSRFHGSYVQTHLTAKALAACQAVDADVTEVVIVV